MYSMNTPVMFYIHLFLMKKTGALLDWHEYDNIVCIPILLEALGLGLSPVLLVRIFELKSNLPCEDILSSKQGHLGLRPSCLDSRLPAYLVGTCEQVTSHMMGTLAWSPVYIAGTCELETSLRDGYIGLESSLHLGDM
jgi:hypothetical protein